jgi:hypothetical protein
LDRQKHSAVSRGFQLKDLAVAGPLDLAEPDDHREKRAVSLAPREQDENASGTLKAHPVVL